MTQCPRVSRLERVHTILIVLSSQCWRAGQGYWRGRSTSAVLVFAFAFTPEPGGGAQVEDGAGEGGEERGGGKEGPADPVFLSTAQPASRGSRITGSKAKPYYEPWVSCAVPLTPGWSLLKTEARGQK